jgi:hypothetical protein
VQQLVEGQAEALTRKALEMAQAGDVACLRSLLNIVSPARKSQTIDIDIHSREVRQGCPGSQ